MSVWEESSFNPVQTLSKTVQSTPNLSSYLYPSRGKPSNPFNRISPETNLSKRWTPTNSNEYSPTSTTQQAFTSSQKSLAPDVRKISNVTPSSTSKVFSCLKSVQCKFLSLGIILGLLISVSAIVPIVLLRETCPVSTSKTTTASTLAPKTVSTSSLIVSTALGNCTTDYCEQVVSFTTNMTITELLLKIVIHREENTTYGDSYSTYAPTINQTYTMTTTQIIYSFFIQSGTIPPGNFSCAAQFQLDNVNHTGSKDTYSVTTKNYCGLTNSASGNCQ